MIDRMPVVVVDIFADIVAKVAIEAAANGICDSVRYVHGPIEELEAELQAIGMAEGLPDYEGLPKYPLIYLLQDFPEDLEGSGGYYSQVNLPLVVIMTLTSNTYKSAERYNNTFKPVLYPLYALLKKYMARNGSIVGNDPDQFTHRKYDRLFYGRRKFGKTVGDYVDAIELTNLQLTMLQQNDPSRC
jgi:hypothetical protein